MAENLTSTPYTTEETDAFLYTSIAHIWKPRMGGFSLLLDQYMQ